MQKCKIVESYPQVVKTLLVGGSGPPPSQTQQLTILHTALITLLMTSKRILLGYYIIQDIRAENNPNIYFQLLNCEDLLVFFVLCDSKLKTDQMVILLIVN